MAAFLTMIGRDTTILTMIGEALGNPEGERQVEGVMMCALLFEKHGGKEVELVEPFASVELTDSFIDCVFAMVRAKVLDQRVLPGTLGSAYWALGKCRELRALAAICASELAISAFCAVISVANFTILTGLPPRPSTGA